MPHHDYRCVTCESVQEVYVPISETPPMSVMCPCGSRCERAWAVPQMMVRNKIGVGMGYAYDLKTYEHLKYNCWPDPAKAYQKKPVRAQTEERPGEVKRKPIKKSDLGNITPRIPKTE